MRVFEEPCSMPERNPTPSPGVCCTTFLVSFLLVAGGRGGEGRGGEGRGRRSLILLWDVYSATTGGRVCVCVYICVLKCISGFVSQHENTSNETKRQHNVPTSPV